MWLKNVTTRLLSTKEKRGRVKPLSPTLLWSQLKIQGQACNHHRERSVRRKYFLNEYPSLERVTGNWHSFLSPFWGHNNGQEKTQSTEHWRRRKTERELVSRHAWRGNKVTLGNHFQVWLQWVSLPSSCLLFCLVYHDELSALVFFAFLYLSFLLPAHSPSRNIRPNYKVLISCFHYTITWCGRKLHTDYSHWKEEIRNVASGCLLPFHQCINDTGHVTLLRFLKMEITFLSPLVRRRERLPSSSSWATVVMKEEKREQEISREKLWWWWWCLSPSYFWESKLALTSKLVVFSLHSSSLPSFSQHRH